MTINEQIGQTKKEIRYCIKYLMLAIKDRLGADREKEVFVETKKKGKVKIHRKDSRFPFELQFDELPYFSLYVNFKYAVYKKLLTLCYKENEITEEDLTEFGIAVKNGEIDFKPLKEFATKPISCMALDLGALEDYLGAIEELLIYTSHAKVVLAIYQELANTERMVKNHIGADGKVKLNEYIEDSDGGYNVDYIRDLLYEYYEGPDNSGNWFYYRIVDEGFAEMEGCDFTFPCGEHIGLAFMEAKALIEENVKSDFANREKVIKQVSNDIYKKYCLVVDTVVSILTISAYEIPYEVILDILSDTLKGMERTVLASKLKKHTLGKDRLFSKGELTKALSKGSEWFSKRVDIYGDKTFTEEELHSALEKLGQPIDLLDFKIS